MCSSDVIGLQNHDSRFPSIVMKTDPVTIWTSFFWTGSIRASRGMNVARTDADEPNVGILGFSPKVDRIESLFCIIAHNLYLIFLYIDVCRYIDILSKSYFQAISSKLDDFGEYSLYYLSKI